MFRMLCALLAAAGLCAAAAAQDADPYEGSFFKRQAIVVSDMERALTLYRDVLGFELHSLTQSSETSYSYEVFNIPREASIRFATLDAGETQIRTLALIEVTGVELAPQTGVRRAAAVINVNGRYDAVLAAVDEMGLDRAEPRALGDADSERGQGIELGFTDWDGNLVVIYQFPGPQGPPSER
jgi:catechol 2,3-dioxygenase-like lactoylglutathione lyase family enzyme